MEAITQIDANGSGVDVRTVQLWFQENERGISHDSIRWLARVVGCGDPEAISEWQAVLSVAQARLVSNRRRKKKKEEVEDVEPLDMVRLESSDGNTEVASDGDANGQKQQFSLGRLSEEMFYRSALNLPAVVFAGAVALGFSSYFLRINAVTYDAPIGVTKQVGFLWAPNWTVLFMVFMPLFFAFAAELLGFWKNEGRLSMALQGRLVESSDAWKRRVEASSHTFWAVAVICLAFAGVFQWVSVRFLPLIRGGGDYATDWGSLAIERPDIISVPSAIVFTGVAYLYMCLCFYLLFAGLILLYLIIDDFWEGQAASVLQQEVDDRDAIDKIGLTVMRGVFRCTVLVILIAMCMKLQSGYLTSSGSNILSWLFGDMVSVFVSSDGASARADYITPNHFSSLLIVLAALFVFIYGAFRIGGKGSFRWSLGMMAVTIALLVFGYLLIGAFEGFSILVGAGVVLAIYALVDPEFGRRPANKVGDRQSVS